MMSNPLIVALDLPSRSEVREFLQVFSKEKLFLKVGMELYYREGAPLIYELKEQGHDIFLDLKLHDIPTTVFRAMKQLAELEVDIVNMHAMGGVDMMKAAKEGLAEGAKSANLMPKCIAVTQLTSTTEEMMQQGLLTSASLDEHVLHLCKQAEMAGLDGVVCSAQEVDMIHRKISPSFLTVTPGIRRKEDAKDDQKRIVTPQEAAKLGSDAIVVGRGITRAEDPLQAYREYKREWEMGR